jgi:hypothetical protein
MPNESSGLLYLGGLIGFTEQIFGADKQALLAVSKKCPSTNN